MLSFANIAICMSTPPLHLFPHVQGVVRLGSRQRGVVRPLKRHHVVFLQTGKRSATCRIPFHFMQTCHHSVKSIQRCDCRLHFGVLRQDLQRKSPDQGQSCCTSGCISAIVRVCSKEVLGAAGCRCQQRIFSFFQPIAIQPCKSCREKPAARKRSDQRPSSCATNP